MKRHRWESMSCRSRWGCVWASRLFWFYPAITFIPASPLSVSLSPCSRDTIKEISEKRKWTIFFFLHKKSISVPLGSFLYFLGQLDEWVSLGFLKMGSGNVTAEQARQKWRLASVWRWEKWGLTANSSVWCGKKCLNQSFPPLHCISQVSALTAQKNNPCLREMTSVYYTNISRLAGRPPWDMFQNSFVRQLMATGKRMFGSRMKCVMNHTYEFC